MHAQISQTGGPEPVIWDYHVVGLEQTPGGFTVWDPACTEGYPLCSARWTEANFPTPDPSVRFRVIEADAYLQNFKSDRRHMISGVTPPWPKISQDENNLDEYRSVAPGPPGAVMDLEQWRKFENQIDAEHSRSESARGEPGLL